jgi:hypothetical protein
MPKNKTLPQKAKNCGLNSTFIYFYLAINAIRDVPKLA